MQCPKCGRGQPPEAAGPFCAHCGQFLVPMRWVATPPPGTGPAPSSAPARGRYQGPPRYLSPPRWGFPALPWRREPPPEPGHAATARLGVQAALLVPLLRGLAVLAALSAASEAWRYLLLLRSRDAALGASEVAASDALVGAASWVATMLTVGAGVLLLRWVLRAMEAADARSGLLGSRSPRAVIWGWLVPGVNLSVPGSVLAEIEHAALDRDPARRPNPSRLVATWWALWASNLVVAGVTTVWLLRTGTQARADGVLQHALLDVLATATALVTARVVVHLTALLSPPRVIPLPRVVRTGAGAAATV